ncbi:MAG TPA: peptidylprolyl isomerase [Longimicrobium sp.]|nr:peptidylprolyl isomerase [Longimicrobium sp.]
MKTAIRLSAAAALLLAACAPAASTGGLTTIRDREATVGGLMWVEDQRRYDSAYLEHAALGGGVEIRRRAALAMGRIRDPRAVPLLGRLLADEDTSVAATAAFALGQIADSAAVPLLAPHADPAAIATRPTVVAEVAYALGKIRHPQARAALERLLQTAGVSGPGDSSPIGHALLAVWRQGRPTPVLAIDPWIRHVDPEIRWRAAYALARRPEPGAAATLFTMAAEPEPLVRSFVARGLTAPMADSSGVGREAALDVLIRYATSDPSEIVKINALRTLGGYQTERALALLTDVAAAGLPHETIVAMESLGRMGSYAAPAVSVLRQEARDREMAVFVRQTALAALAEIDPAAAVEVARAVEREPGWRLRSAAARAYAEAGARADLARMVRDPDGRVAAAALEQAVTVAGDSAAGGIRDLLLEGVALPDVIARTNALGGLTRLADPATLPVVLGAYQRAQADSMNDAALAAVDAVAAIARKEPDAARQFFARFPRSGDYLVRQRVHAAFGDTVPGAWGDWLPVETGMDARGYGRIADQARARPRPRAVIETDRGNIEVELFADDAPLTVRSFLSLAERGFFDGQEWPRVVPNFVIQGGDPRGDTSGGPGYSIRDEINRHLYQRGTLGMALSGPDTGGSQWFITHSPQPHLDGTYTVFGRVVRGMDVVDVILPGDRIIRIREVR